jgi:hypothetical protein
MEPTAISAEGMELYTSPVYWFPSVIVAIILLAAMWRIYSKAGQPGWAAIVPVYNVYVLLKIVGRPGWWLLLYLVPVVNLIVWIIVQLDLAQAFGKGVGFALGLILLPGLFHLILGFGGATYRLQQAGPQPSLS